MPATVETPQSCEAGARDYWARHRATDLRYEKYGTMVVASTELVKAVVLLLGEFEIEVVAAPPVRKVPGEDHLEYGALSGSHAGREVVVPLVPGSPELRVFAAADGTAVGELVATVTVPAERVEKNGWVPAAAITEQLRGVLAS